MADAANTKGVREASYRAQVLPTGLGRLMVVKSDPGRGLCLALTLLHGPSGPRLPVDVAPPWRVEKVGAWLTGGDCDRAQISPPDGWARTASGTIRLRPDGDRCLIDLDVRILFDARSGLRPVELMIASGVPFMEGEQPCGPRRGGAPPPPVRR